MRTAIAIAFGWFCGATAALWIPFPASLAFALLCGFAFGVVEALVDRGQESSRT